MRERELIKAFSTMIILENITRTFVEDDYSVALVGGQQSQQGAAALLVEERKGCGEM